MMYRIRELEPLALDCALPWRFQVEGACGCLGWMPHSIHATREEAETALANLSR